MSDEPKDMGQLLRRALQAEIELGSDEIILPGRESKGRPAEDADDIAVMDTPLEGDRVPKETQPLPATLDVSPQTQYESMEAHRAAICNCQECPLGETRTKFVYGVGNPDADLMFIGEAPGADEDRIGEPFVGRAGKLLDSILKAMNLTREQVYIANILKCRPPQNRDPQPAEMEKCFPYLREQVRLIKPKVICALGRISAQALLQTKTPLGKLREQWHEYEGVPLRVTYHPAALLRFQQYKRPTWEDMQEIMARYDKLNGSN